MRLKVTVVQYVKIRGIKLLDKSVTFVKNHMKAFLVIADVASLLFAIWFSAALKFDAVIRLPEWFLNNFIYIGLLSIVTMLASFFFFKIYKRMWQYFIA